jgi:hypothetical protein
VRTSHIAAMSFRPPRLGIAGRRSFDNPMEAEILAEKAAGLARSGGKVEDTLAALRALGAEAPGRDTALRAAADAVYAFFVQRELCGLRDHRSAIEHYAISREVLVRVGAR